MIALVWSILLAATKIAFDKSNCEACIVYFQDIGFRPFLQSKACRLGIQLRLGPFSREAYLALGIMSSFAP